MSVVNLGEHTYTDITAVVIPAKRLSADNVNYPEAAFFIIRREVQWRKRQWKLVLRKKLLMLQLCVSKGIQSRRLVFIFFFIMNSSSPDVTKSRNECILFDTFLSHSSLPQSFNEKAILCHWWHISSLRSVSRKNSFLVCCLQAFCWHWEDLKNG